MLIRKSCRVFCVLAFVAFSTVSLRAEDGARPRQFTRTFVDVGRSTAPSVPAAPRAGGVIIVPTFDASITKDKRAADIMAAINLAIADYAAKLTDPITVQVTFKNVSTGLGASLTSVTTVSYVDYLAALKKKAVSNDDKTALATLPDQATNPVTGDTDMKITLALGRALGLREAGIPGVPDSTIELNIDLMNITATDNDQKKFSLKETAQHELDEVLGTSSELDGGTTGPVAPADLFRYDANGKRIYVQDPKAESFFSIDGKNTLAKYNQDKSGDFGDWFSINGGQTPQIQDAFGTPGGTPVELGVELVVLDVVGYTRADVPAAALPGAPPPAQPPLPPVIGSVACVPNPAYIGGVANFTVGATSPNKSPLTAAWDFGDGSKGAGLNTTHTYDAAGTYTATATVTDGAGLMATSTVSVNVNLQIGNGTITKKKFQLNFKFPNDNAASGFDVIDVTMGADGFAKDTDGKTIKFVIGEGTMDDAVLDAKGKGFGTYGNFTVNAKKGTARYATKFMSLQGELALFGATNATTTATLQIPITFYFDGAIIGDTPTFQYSAIEGKVGKGK